MKLQKYSGKPKRLKFIIRRVSGDSMLPSLKPGSIVIARRTRRARPGQIVIIEHQGLEKIKRLKLISESGIYVLGDNPLASTDSRSFGLLPTSAITAVTIWPRSHKLK